MFFLKRFFQDRRGSLAPMFALAIIPAVGFVGAAIDYSHANSVKAAMQAALDSTALMLSKEAPTISTSQLQTKATAYFQAVFNRPEATGVAVTPVFDASKSTLTMNGTATMATNFMKVMGFPSLTITGTSTVTWGNTRLRVALVLDNTGSMADYNKIGALKTATKNLLTTLQNASTNVGDVYVSIVPFVKDVAVDTTLKGSNWIDWTDWNANNGTCTGYGHHNQGAPTNPTDCASRSGTWTANNHNTWNGCITDRGNSNGPASGNYDTNAAAPNTGITASLFPAEQYDSCPQPVMGLSLQLVGDDHAGQQHVAGRQYQPGHRSRLGLAVARRRWAVQRSGHGPQLPVSADHHPADRRVEHRGSLVHRSELDRRAPGDHLRQRQGGRHHALYGAGQYRRRSDVATAEDLRERLEQVLPAHLRERDREHLQPDRNADLAAPHLEVISATARPRKRQSPASRPGFFHCEGGDGLAPA